MGKRAKYRLECLASDELTAYNKKYNQEIMKECMHRYKHLFEPRLDCLGCKYLKATKLT